MQIQDRDRLIVDTSYEQQFLGADQIERYVFKGASPRRTRQRISDLERAGLIRREEHLVLHGRRIIRLTSSGVAVAEQGRSVFIPQVKKLDARTLIHDSLVTSVRFRLRELWDGAWIPESLLKSEEFPQIPDGMFVFFNRPNRNQVAIEVEHSSKGPERFHAIQERWRNTPVRLVLYVATSPEMYRVIRRYLETGPQDLPFGLVRIDELESGIPKVWTVGGELDLLSRRSF